jgi:maltooligosyltrehalose trehalohydrolase
VEEDCHKEMLEWYRALIRLRRRSISLNDGDMGHVKVRYSEADRWLAMDRGGVRVLANLGQQEAVFDVAEAFRLALVSREGVEAKAGNILLPPNTLAVLSCEPD